MMRKRPLAQLIPNLMGFTALVLLVAFLAPLSFAATVTLGPIGDVTTWPDTSYRWKDINDQLYAENYHKKYNYGKASAELTYNEIDTGFRGSFVASGLKPNFAYQMKLVGYSSHTEESFHQHNIENGGKWASVMGGMWIFRWFRFPAPYGSLVRA